jgi:hypothetical protein
VRSGGWALAHYSGAFLLVPALGTFLLLLVFAKTAFRPHYFGGAISVTGGHLLWFITAASILRIWRPVMIDIIVLTIAVIWLWLRPGLAAAIFLGFVQIISFGGNLIALFSATVGEPPHRALVVHCLFRVLALACLAFGYRRLRQEQMAEVELQRADAPPSPNA